ncbi:MAG: FMN-binding protein [Spirochaetales bacterium]|nr:FMN-binding protein [Spirochaetales bacterium]
MNMKIRMVYVTLAVVEMMLLSSCLINKQPELTGTIPPESMSELVYQEGHIPYYFPEMEEFGDLSDGEYVGILSGSFIDRGKVKVTVANGVITDVKILKVTLWAPDVRKEHRQGEIKEGLPEQVIERQSIDVDAVSGATGTTHVFKTCVTRALWQASGKPDPMESCSPY